MQLPDIDRLVCALGLTSKEADKFSEYYNTKMGEYGNEIYEQIESRITHWCNFIQQGWFTGRLDYFLDNALDYDVVVDLGFSVPYPYARKTLVEGDTRFIFVDSQASAIVFYLIFRQLAGLETKREQDVYLQANIENPDHHERILTRLRALHPASILIVASEVIEHLNKPAIAWDLVKQIEKIEGVNKSGLYLTLPVGEQIPSHTLEFFNAAKARSFVTSNMTIRWESVMEAPIDFPARPYLQQCYCAFGTTKANQ